MVKGINADVRKISVVDTKTNTPFPMVVPEDYLLERLEFQKTYFASFKVYTLKDVKDVGADFVDFFTAVDIDQSIEDFLKAYWLFPNYIKFELTEIETM